MRAGSSINDEGVAPLTERDRPRIFVEDEDGRRVAAADIEVVDGTAARASLHVESGQLPVGTRARLVDAVLDTPEVRSCEHVQVALPLGDTEILDRVRERCDPGDVRAAGASCLVEADLAGSVEAGSSSGTGDESSTA
jgi:hypothetical protein